MPVQQRPQHGAGLLRCCHSNLPMQEIFKDNQHKAADMNIDKEHITAATANSFTRHCVLERDCISLLKGYGQALVQKFLSDDSDGDPSRAPA